MTAITDSNSGKWTDYLKYLTPILLTASLFVLGSINAKIDLIDGKLFSHLTENELHTARSQLITKAEFSIYQELRQRQLDDVKALLSDMKIDNSAAHASILLTLTKHK